MMEPIRSGKFEFWADVAGIAQRLGIDRMEAHGVACRWFLAWQQWGKVDEEIIDLMDVRGCETPAHWDH